MFMNRRMFPWVDWGRKLWFFNSLNERSPLLKVMLDRGSFGTRENRARLVKSRSWKCEIFKHFELLWKKSWVICNVFGPTWFFYFVFATCTGLVPREISCWEKHTWKKKLQNKCRPMIVKVDIIFSWAYILVGIFDRHTLQEEPALLPHPTRKARCQWRVCRTFCTPFSTVITFTVDLDLYSFRTSKPLRCTL